MAVLASHSGDAPVPDVGGIAGDRLRSFIERIERLDAELKTLNDDKKEIFAEAKGVGFDTKIMKIVMRRRRMDASDLDEEETLVDVYERAISKRRPDREAAE